MAARGLGPVYSEVETSKPTEPFECDFAGMRLVVDRGVFEPGPISHGVVQELTARCAGIASPVIADVGTGTGAIALAFAQLHPSAVVYALDVSREAVACAAHNVNRLQIRNVQVLHGSLLEPLRDRVHELDAVVANVPWVPEAIAGVKELLRPDRWRGPRSTIVGAGRDGLGLLRELVAQADPLLRPDGVIILEMDDWQTEVFAREYGDRYDVAISPTRHFVTLRRRSA